MKKAIVLIAALLIMLLPCLAANAYPSSGSITVVMINKADKQPLENREATVIKVADCSFTESDITFSLNSDFSDTGVDLKDSDSAQALYSSAVSKGLTGQSIRTDADGIAVLSSCEIGAYLVYSPDKIFTPFLVFVPMVTDDGSCFDITAEPKIDIPEETVTQLVPTPGTTQPTPDSAGEKLPQTGMLQYPVPLLGLCGVLMFSKGFVMYVNGRKEDN